MFPAVERRALTGVLNRRETPLVDPFEPRTPWDISFGLLHGVKMGCGTDAVSVVLVHL
jgi:hypothetical protein